MDNFIKLLNETKDRKFDITTTAKGVKNLQQTQRNAWKAELLQALLVDIADKYEFVGMGEKGLVFDIANDCVADTVSPHDSGSGGITVILDLTVKDLDTNATDLIENYNFKVAEKAEKAKAKAKTKAEKIARDTANRAKKKEGGE